MVGDLGTADPSYSDLTFALFEDTGWYKVNWDYVQPLNWGKGEGCDFVKTKCITDDTTAAYDEFCVTLFDAGNTKWTCDYNHLHAGFCNLVGNVNPPASYQYFTDTAKGGQDPNMDFCPYVQPGA
jgi:hypothetical protein